MDTGRGGIDKILLRARADKIRGGTTGGNNSGQQAVKSAGWNGTDLSIDAGDQNGSEPKEDCGTHVGKQRLISG